MLDRHPSRVWLTIAVLLIALLGIGTVFVEQHERESLADARRAAENELGLLTSMVKAELQGGNYQLAQEILQNWGKAQPDVEALRLLSGKDFAIAEYQRAAPAERILTLEAPIRYSYAGEARLILRTDLDHVTEHRNRTIVQLSAAYAIVAGMLLILTRLALVYRQQSVRLQVEIAQREIADEQLREGKEQILQLLTEKETILSNALVGIAYIKQRHVVSCNRRLEEIFQYEPGELLGESTERLYDSRETFDHIGTLAYRKASEADGYTGEARLRHKDGSLFWGMMNGKAVDPAHPHEGSIWIYSDITARKEAEADLRIAACAFESQEAMMVTDADSVILRVNHAFTEITGYAAEDVVGLTPRILKSGRHNADFYRDMWESVERTGGWQGEIWDRRKNGEEYPKWLTISTVRDDEGKVTHYIGTHHDITERKQAEERINDLAFYDQLTALPNRTLLLDRLKQAMTAGSRGGNYGALLFIDLDNFKTLNDTLGHDMGDLLLKQVAQRLTTCVRAGDTVARLGGDEFVVMLASLSTGENDAAAQAEAVGEKILAALNQAYQLKSVAHHSTSSIGVTLFRGHLAAIDDLLKQADLAMYKAKEAGRNALRFFDPDMEIAVMKRADLEKNMRAALDARQFLLHYQPQLAGGKLAGAEVLVRWQHPGRGMVSPAEFIPLAEETGLILPLGRWVLETACGQLARWASRPEMANLTVAVNVSAHQFRQADFVDQVLAVLEDTGANPRRLKLELTESLLVSNIEETVEKMFALKGKGVGFALDDFGTGYSSLSYLKRLPLDQLKIDQSFVRDVLSDPNDASIARTIIALAQNLGLGVIAEGVETEAQRDFLAGSGCHAYQGYLFSRPLPIEGFEQFARHNLETDRQGA